MLFLRSWLDFFLIAVWVLTVLDETCACNDGSTEGFVELRLTGWTSVFKLKATILAWISKLSKFCGPSSSPLSTESGGGAAEVSISTTSLSAWPNGDERDWLFAKQAVLSSGHIETEVKEVQIHYVCKCVCSQWHLDYVCLCALSGIHKCRIDLCVTERLLLFLLSLAKSASGLRLYRKCRCTQKGSEWIRALPLEPCGLFKDAVFCLNEPTNSIRELISRHQ